LRQHLYPIIDALYTDSPLPLLPSSNRRSRQVIIRRAALSKTIF